MKFDYIPFKPLAVCKNPYLQTIAAPYLHVIHKTLTKDIYTNHLVDLSDNDKISLLESKPLNWQEDDRIVLMLHGLTGDHESNYMQRIGEKLLNLGYIVMRFNHRNCGLGLGYSRRPYNSGASNDARDTLKYIQKLYPKAKVTIVGFSMSGNLTLKMAGEDKDYVIDNLESVIAVCPPADLHKSSKRLSKNKKNNFIEKHFISELISHVKTVEDFFPDMPKTLFPENLTLKEFDNIYTAPKWGYRDVNEYYTKASSSKVIEDIEVPTLIVHSKDDPIISGEYLYTIKNTNIHKVITKHGGHLGFIANPTLTGNIRWLDYIIINWLEYIKSL